MGKKVLQIVGDQSIETLVHEYCFLLFPANSKSVPGQSISEDTRLSPSFREFYKLSIDIQVCGYPTCINRVRG